MYDSSNNESRSCNHCCSRKSVSITYSEYVFVILGIKHDMRVRHIVTVPVWLYHILPHYIKRQYFGKIIK
jgi:hypothetical protein